MGDFNINLLNCENYNPESNDFLQMLNSYFFLPYILQPTRITERSATLIDNIFANSYSMDAISGNLVLKISDHLPQFLNLLMILKLIIKFLITLKMIILNLPKINLSMIFHILTGPVFLTMN